MILDRAVGRDVQKILRHEQRHEGHHLKVGLERAEFVPHLRLAVGRRLIDRQLGGERRFFQRIGLLRRPSPARHRRRRQSSPRLSSASSTALPNACCP